MESILQYLHILKVLLPLLPGLHTVEMMEVDSDAEDAEHQHHMNEDTVGLISYRIKDNNFGFAVIFGVHVVDASLAGIYYVTNMDLPDHYQTTFNAFDFI